jgi:hypothetical protein
MENKKEVTIEDLAGMVQKGFLEIKGDIQQLKDGQEKLFKGQEEMNEKLDKKVSVWEHKELAHRVETLELKAELRR